MAAFPSIPVLDDDAALAASVYAGVSKGERDLLDSLQQLALAAPSLALSPLVEELEQRLSRSDAPLSPWVYLGYYQVGVKILTGQSHLHPDFHDQFRREIQREQAAGEILDFGDPDRCSPQQWQLALSAFQQGGDFHGELEAPEPPLSQHFRQVIIRARSLIPRLDPDLGCLIDRLQPLVVLCRPSASAWFSGKGFGNATCFFFRGGSLFNASRASHPVMMMERLVHEYAHAELFVLAQDAPLCLNGDEERHHVLIRSDRRPMNGILHSLHVVSRVCGLLNRALTEAIAPIEDREEIASACRVILAQQLEYGASSLEAVRRHGRLTALGQAVLEAATSRLSRCRVL